MSREENQSCFSRCLDETPEYSFQLETVLFSWKQSCNIQLFCFIFFEKHDFNALVEAVKWELCKFL